MPTSRHSKNFAESPKTCDYDEATSALTMKMNENKRKAKGKLTQLHSNASHTDSALSNEPINRNDDQGAVVEQGTQRVMQAKGRYYALYRQQDQSEQHEEKHQSNQNTRT